MYTLYFHKSPNTYKIAMALEELKASYQTVVVKVGEGEQFAPSFKQISPNNKVPVLIDSEPQEGSEKVVVFESNAILLYLARKERGLLPADERQIWDVMQWLFWQASGQGPMFGQCVHFNTFAPDNPYAKWRFDREATRLLQVLEDRLEGRDHVAGNDFTVADIACFPWVHRKASHCYGHATLQEFPNIRRWRDRIEGRPATIKAYERLDRDEGTDQTNLEEFCRNQFGHDPAQAKEAAVRARETLLRAGMHVSAGGQ